MELFGTTGQQRRAWLDGALNNALRTYLGPTGIPDRLNALNEIFNPVVGIEQSSVATRNALNSDLEPSQRALEAGRAGLEVLGVVAPAAGVAYRGGVSTADDVARAVEDVYTGFAYGPGGEFMADEFGGAKTPELIAHHNTSAEKLAFADDLGGMPMPSVAISRADAPLTNFGNITLLGGPETFAIPSRQNRVFRGDGYTLRQPRPDLKIDSRELAQEMGNDPRFSHMRGPSWFIDSHTTLEDADNAFKRVELAIDRGLVNPKDYESMDDLMYATRRALLYSDDASDMPGLRQYSPISMELAPEEPFTPSGNRRKGKPYTLENVTARMRKEARHAGAEGANYGVPSFRAHAEPPLRTYRQVSDARSTIAPQSETEQAFESFTNDYYGVLQGVADETGIDNSFAASDSAAAFMNDYAAGRTGDWRGSWADNLSPEYSLAEIDRLIEKSRNLPVGYLEAKPQRAVTLDEFDAAIIPKGDVQSRERLTENGIKRILEYGSGEERVELFKRFPDLMFSVAGAAAMLGLSAEDLQAQAAENNALADY